MPTCLTANHVATLAAKLLDGKTTSKPRVSSKCLVLDSTGWHLETVAASIHGLKEATTCCLQNTDRSNKFKEIFR